MSRARYLRMGVTRREEDFMSRLVLALGSTGKSFKAFVFIDPETFEREAA